MKAYEYNLGTGMNYDDTKKGRRLPVQNTYSVKEIFSDKHSWDRKIKTGFQRNPEDVESERKNNNFQ